MCGTTVKGKFQFWVCIPGCLGDDASRVTGTYPKGTLHLHDCPAQRMIPICAIALGGIWTLYNLFKIPYEMRKLCSSTEPQKNFCCACIVGVIQFIFLACFIAACYWVYSTYPYIEEKNVKSDSYCAPLLFRFLFWLLSSVLILFVVIIFVIVVVAVVTWCIK